MRNTFTRNEFALAAACALALGFFSETALAQPAWGINEKSLLVDSRGAPVMSGFGTCARTDRRVFIEISGTRITK